MIRLVHVPALGRSHVVAAGVIAGVAHELGTVLPIEMLANSHIYQRAERLIKEIILLILKLVRLYITILIKELVEEFQLLTADRMLEWARLLLIITEATCKVVRLEYVVFGLAIKILVQQTFNFICL